MDVLKLIENIKTDLKKKYGDVLREEYSPYECRLTYYCSDLLAMHGLDHDENYRWTQDAINAAFIAGYRVAMFDKQKCSGTEQNQIIESMIDNLKDLLV